MKQFIIIFQFQPLSFAKVAPFKDMIRAYGSYAFVSDNSCVIWSNSLTTTAVGIRDYLKTGMGSNDKLFVAEISAPAAWSALETNVSDYLVKNLKDI